MTDGCKELLMPSAQKDPAATMIKSEPGALVFNMKTEGQTVTSNKAVKDTLDQTYKSIPIFFQQRIILQSQKLM
jgi:hypothetical protein